MMKAAQIIARGQIELVDAPDPAAPKPGQVVVTAETGCLCGSDIPFFSQGPIGLLFDACLSSLGAARIIGIDAREERVSRSCEFGATDVFVTRDRGGRDAIDHVAQLTGGAMADLVVEAVGHAEQQFNL